MIGKWVTICGLCALVGVGALMRVDRMTRESLWVDEYWALYLATGRGNVIFQVPLNTVVREPPACNFRGAPGWWHIFGGLGTTPHPPMYHLVLRWWVDIFGDGDGATRGLSLVLGLMGVVVIFDVGRLLGGKVLGLMAAGMMTFAPIQIDFSQQDRPYTLAALLALVMWREVLAIEKKGISRRRLAVLGAATGALALTHYLAAGVIAAAVVYAWVRMGRRERNWAAVVMAGVVVIVYAAWGPVAWRHRGELIIAPNYARMNVSLMWAAIDAPRKILFGELGRGPGKIAAEIAMAVIVYFSPVVRRRRERGILLPWLWVMGGIGLLVGIDVMRQSELVYLPRYIFIAAPGVYLAASFGWGKGAGRLLPGAVLAATILFGVDRWQAGPQFDSSAGAVAKVIAEKVRPGDAVIITGQFESEPAFKYFSIAHYAGDWRNPVVFATEKLGPGVDSALARYRRVWVVGRDERDMKEFLPGWTSGEYFGVSPGFSVWSIRRAVGEDR